MNSLGKRDRDSAGKCDGDTAFKTHAIEDILEEKEIFGIKHCLVKWVDVPQKYSTWEPLEKLRNCAHHHEELGRRNLLEDYPFNKQDTSDQSTLNAKINSPLVKLISSNKKRIQGKCCNKKMKKNPDFFLDEDSTSIADLKESDTEEICTDEQARFSTLNRCEFESRLCIGMKLTFKKPEYDPLGFYRNFTPPMLHYLPEDRQIEYEKISSEIDKEGSEETLEKSKFKIKSEETESEGYDETKTTEEANWTELNPTNVIECRKSKQGKDLGENTEETKGKGPINSLNFSLESLAKYSIRFLKLNHKKILRGNHLSSDGGSRDIFGKFMDRGNDSVSSIKRANDDKQSTQSPVDLIKKNKIKIEYKPISTFDNLKVSEKLIPNQPTIRITSFGPAFLRSA